MNKEICHSDDGLESEGQIYSKGKIITSFVFVTKEDV